MTDIDRVGKQSTDESAEACSQLGETGRQRGEIGPGTETAPKGVLLGSESGAGGQNLEEQADFLHHLLDSLNHPFYVIDARNYSILMANSAAQTRFGPSRGKCYSFAHGLGEPCHMSGHICPVVEVTKTRKPVMVEHVHYDKHGHPRNVEVHAHPIYDSEGNVAQVIAYTLDITDRKRVEQALRESELRMRSIAESAADAIVSANSDDEITFWNKAAERMFGYAEQEVLGRPVTILMPQSFGELDRLGLGRHGVTEDRTQTGSPIRLSGLRKGGKKFPLELSLSTWKSKQKVFFTGIMRDITEREEIEEELKRLTADAQRRTEELKSLIQMVAHDLKSPVLTIAGLVRSLTNCLETEQEREKRGKILEQLGKASRQMEAFLKDLLNSMAIEESEPELAPVNLFEIIHSVVAQHQQHADEKRISVRVVADEAGPAIRGDERRLREVLDNLLMNAVQHMGDVVNREIEIRLGQMDRFVMIRVSDNGMGIPPGFQNKIFDRFFSSPRSESKRGSGLGLFIVKKIVESHGGQIWVESEEGAGATFCFTLPLMIGRSLTS